ncbi:pilus assembly protein TadG-related protein [Streptomyces chumphonensis]|uniref:Flp pilus-assembly TadG-like N-terminal domain-containing protein n=1 Tax=Streptomyces chumphonensis TaxID=1214925 RepID=A0A927F2K2_9ACTN|nr:pilus assembly protein TadG-related protein [Streptomyces chumphonensis]MBD3933552.1 hypothetical protein [Streptomyces chumphonensis]
MAGLLFLALAYFAFGQSAASRSEAQGSADAAALAVAYDIREQFADRLLEDSASPSEVEEALLGRSVLNGDPCRRAEYFAEENNAEALSCSILLSDEIQVEVGVKALESVGDTVVPGTSDRYATAAAKTAIEPLCALSPGSGGSNGEEEGRVKLVCEEGEFSYEPGEVRSLPGLDVLFSIRLVE